MLRSLTTATGWTLGSHEGGARKLLRLPPVPASLLSTVEIARQRLFGAWQGSIPTSAADASSSSLSSTAAAAVTTTTTSMTATLPLEQPRRAPPTTLSSGLSAESTSNPKEDNSSSIIRSSNNGGGSASGVNSSNSNADELGSRLHRHYARVGGGGGSDVVDGGGDGTNRGYIMPDYMKNLQGLRVKAFLDRSSGTAPSVATGRIVARLTESVYAVELPHMLLSPIVEVGGRVHVEYGRDDQNGGSVIGGVVVRVNGNGTVGVMLDNNSYDLGVPLEMIALVKSQTRYTESPEFHRIVEWMKTSGVTRRSDQQRMAAVLFQRGWRADKLYLLEASDVHCMTFIPRSVRMCVLDKSEWQRDHHRQMRQLLKERIKEQDFRYCLTKYSGVVSASMAFLGISVAFLWNVKNYQRQKREYQLRLAVNTLRQTSDATTLSARESSRPLKTSLSTPVGERNAAMLQGRQFVNRQREEDAVRKVLRRLDTSHPRIAVFTGLFGCGKSTVCRSAMVKEGLPALYVDIAEEHVDTMRSVAKALGVQNLDVCGDLLDFVAEAFRKSREGNHGVVPLLVLKLRDGGSFTQVYSEAVSLACDRRVCHLLIEVPLESLTMADTSLPRLDFYTVPNFNMQQAYQYTQHSIDPVELAHFFEVMGTNSNALDELFAAVHQRGLTTSEYANRLLLKSMRQIQVAVAGKPELRLALRRLSKFPYDEGQRSGVAVKTGSPLKHPSLSEIVFYDPVRDVWRFRSKVHHTAAQCSLPSVIADAQAAVAQATIAEATAPL